MSHKPLSGPPTNVSKLWKCFPLISGGGRADPAAEPAAFPCRKAAEHARRLAQQGGIDGFYKAEIERALLEHSHTGAPPAAQALPKKLGLALGCAPQQR